MRSVAYSGPGLPYIPGSFSNRGWIRPEFPADPADVTKLKDVSAN